MHSKITQILTQPLSFCRQRATPQVHRRNIYSRILHSKRKISSFSKHTFFVPHRNRVLHTANILNSTQEYAPHRRNNPHRITRHTMLHTETRSTQEKVVCAHSTKKSKHRLQHTPRGREDTHSSSHTNLHTADRTNFYKC